MDPVTTRRDSHLDSGIAVEVRAFVLEAGRRRMLPFTAYVGVPGVAPPALVQPEPAEDLDVLSRADLVERVVDGLEDVVVEGRRACAWTTRSGAHAAGSLDLLWLHAAREGFARHGLELPAFYVIGRYGYHELLGDRERRWRRVRTRRLSPPVPVPATPWAD